MWVFELLFRCIIALIIMGILSALVSMLVMGLYFLVGEIYGIYANKKERFLDWFNRKIL